MVSIPSGCGWRPSRRPTRQELEHDFLWRIERQVPAPGIIGAFNRSHYEDVLVPRVHGDFPATVWSRRYDEINGFERRLTEQGVLLIKCFLHISPAVQEKRLLARLDNPRKSWKYDPEDVTERARWDSYLDAYNDALTACRSPDAPWWIIPSDRKWYRNWAVAALLTQRLQDLYLATRGLRDIRPSPALRTECRACVGRR